jgi:hypothetical protein
MAANQQMISRLENGVDHGRGPGDARLTVDYGAAEAAVARS